MEKEVPDSNITVNVNDLKVTELRLELEKRSLDKTGVKVNLVDRLRKALLEEGKDPENFSIEAASEKPSETKTIDQKEISEDAPETQSNGDEAGNLNVSEEESSQNCENISETLQLSVGDEEIHLNEEEENSIDVSSKDTDDGSAEYVKGVTTSSEQIESLSNESVPLEKQLKKYNNEGNVVSSEDCTVEAVGSKSSVVTQTSSKVVNSTPAFKPKPNSGKILKVLGKDDKVKRVALTAKNLWISGLASTTKAADLRALFSKQGKVISAKIVTNAKHVVGTKKYFGFVTMSSSKDASKCIQTLHRTELNGRTISVERTRHDPGTLLKRTEARTVPTKKTGAKDIKSITTIKPATEGKKTIPINDAKGDKVSESKENDTAESAETEVKEPVEEKASGHDREHRSRDYRDDREYHRMPFRPFGFRGRGRGRGFMFRDRPPMDGFRRPFIRRQFFGRPTFRPPLRPRFLTFEKMRGNDLSPRDHFREREIRESERRRAEEDFRHKLIERKQREEAYRLEREKDCLRIEREMLDRERAEILKAERVKQRLERERLEQESELRHQIPIRYSQKKPYSVGSQAVEPTWEERKRVDPRYDDHPTYHKEESNDRKRKYEFHHSDRQSYSRGEFDHSQRFDREKPNLDSVHNFKDHREPRREVTIRVHDDRRIYKRSDIRGHVSERSYNFREPERHAPPKHVVPISEWKTHERRVSNSGREREYY